MFFVMFVTYVNSSEVTLLLIANVGLFSLIPFRASFSLINNHIGETLCSRMNHHSIIMTGLDLGEP